MFLRRRLLPAVASSANGKRKVRVVKWNVLVGRLHLIVVVQEVQRLEPSLCPQPRPEEDGYRGYDEAVYDQQSDC